MERDFQNQIIKIMQKAGMMVTHHTDKWKQGVPDLSYSGKSLDGWVELKYLAKPPSPTKPFCIPNLTSDQAIYLERKGETGSGLSFLFLYIENVGYYLWNYHYVRNLCKFLVSSPPTFIEAADNCRWINHGALDKSFLIKCLTGFQRNW